MGKLFDQVLRLKLMNGEPLSIARKSTLKELKEFIGVSYMVTKPTGNLKVIKSMAEDNVYTGILHLAPHKLSQTKAYEYKFGGVIDSGPGLNTCPWAGSCVSVCLNTAGHGGIGLDGDGLNNCQRARIRRTRALFHRSMAVKARAWELLKRDIARIERYARKVDMIPAIRLNGTSDIRWERVKDPSTGKTIPELFPGIQFYDYTKADIDKYRKGRTSNYHLTFSRQPENDEQALRHLENGHNVAVCFEKMPKTWKGFEVKNADKSDARMFDKSTDGRGMVMGLGPKGQAVNSTNGFVIREAA